MLESLRPAEKKIDQLAKLRLSIHRLAADGGRAVERLRTIPQHLEQQHEHIEEG